MSIEQSHCVTLDTYKKLSKIEWMEGDEKFDSVLTGWDEELRYEANIPKIKPKITKKKATKTIPTHTCPQCGNNDKKMFKSKSFFGVRAKQCMRCGYRA